MVREKTLQTCNMRGPDGVNRGVPAETKSGTRNVRKFCAAISLRAEFARDDLAFCSRIRVFASGTRLA